MCKQKDMTFQVNIILKSSLFVQTKAFNSPSPVFYKNTDILQTKNPQQLSPAFYENTTIIL